MGYYYFAVVPEYKLLVRLGHSRFDKDDFDELEIPDEMPDELMGAIAWTEDFMELTFPEAGEVVDGKMRTKVVNHLQSYQDFCCKMSELLENVHSLSVKVLFEDKIEKVIGEEHLKDYKDYTVIE